MWSLDLGTTNTLLARWDKEAGKPKLLDLPRLCRQPSEAELPRAASGALCSAGARSAGLVRAPLLDRPARGDRPRGCCDRSVAATGLGHKREDSSALLEARLLSDAREHTQ